MANNLPFLSVLSLGHIVDNIVLENSACIVLSIVHISTPILPRGLQWSVDLYDQLSKHSSYVVNSSIPCAKQECVWI